ncbi:MAG TPA: hypothetical protein VIU02_08590 [Burkholderiales bacterium]
MNGVTNSILVVPHGLQLQLMKASFKQTHCFRIPRTHAAAIRLERAASAQFQERRNCGHLVRRHQLSADRSILLTADGGA